MIISDDFVFLHLQKCGGSFVRTVLVEHFGAKKVGPNHDGYLNIRDKDKEKFIFGTIRNPYSWYISLYHKHREDVPKSFFRTTLHGDPSFPVWLKRFMTAKGRMHDIDFNHAAKLDIGPYTYRAMRSYGLNRQPRTKLDIRFAKIHYIKTADLNHGLSSLLQERLDKDKVESILNKEKIHTSTHMHYLEYYDQESKDLVYQKDKLIFDRWNFSP